MNFRENLFIFDIANNHNGDFDHGIRILDTLGEITRKLQIRAAVKFQFRNLDTFLLPAHFETKNKYAQRFSNTKLTEKQFYLLRQAAK
jgi:sialic acid synthase SpsE